MPAGTRGSWDSGHWRPDTRVSLGGAVAAALLLMTGFAALFSAAPKLTLFRDTAQVTERLLLAEPLPSLPPPRPRIRTSPAPARLPLLHSAWPPLPTPIVAPGGLAQQDYLEERASANAAALRGQVTGQDLQRELGKQAAKPVLSDNQGYRSVDGQKIVRAGGGCAQIQTVQASSSPTNRIDIAEPISCPGGTPDASQEMGRALDDWAKKVQQSQPLPP